MTSFPHLRAAIVSQPWAIMPDRLEAIAEVIERRVSGVRLSADEIAEIKGERAHNGTLEIVSLGVEAAGPRSSGGAQQGSIAVINIMGIIAQHASQVDNISGPGGTSTERLTNSFRSAMADPNIVGIIFNVDSPGGNVGGVQVLADEIRAARGQKPIVAQVNSMMASAAYWIGCAADEVVMTPGSMAGSIGVYSLHKDVSVAAEKEGVKFTFISAGKYKVEGNQFQPLTDEAMQATQSQVDAFYGDFTVGVGNSRGVSASAVRDGFGQGRMLKDKEAVKAGLADRVDTMDGTIKRMASGKIKSRAPKAIGLGSVVAEGVLNDLQSRFASGGIIDRKEARILVGGDDREAVLPLNLQPAALEPAEPQANDPIDVEIHTPAAEAEPQVPAAQEPDPVEIAAADRDAFRRRRHAHRLRNQ